ncbi:MAG: phosphoglucosamine mutase [Candidatus Methylacidiphilales bacterium]
MSVKKYFGTDGIRETYGVTPMTPEFLYQAGRAVASLYPSLSLSAPTVVVGRDTRDSGPVLEAAFCQGVLDGGGSCLRIGILPTAAISLMTCHVQAPIGAMISASHNPHHDNGIKFFNSKGHKLTDEEEWAIEKSIDQQCRLALPHLEDPALLGHSTKALSIYSEHLRRCLPAEVELSGIRLIVDVAHGAAYQSSPEILRNLGCEVIPLHDQPTGTNINHLAGSQHPESACQVVIKNNQGITGNSWIGLCHDGDADRLLLIDEKGVPLDGDEMLAILADRMLRDGKLKHNTLVVTVMSNLGLDELMSQRHGRLVRTPVGDRHVMQALAEGGYSLGGEQSGHVVFPDLMPTGDGLLTALQVLLALKTSGLRLYQARNLLHRYPQKLFNIPVREKRKLEELPQIVSALHEAEQKLGTRGRVYIRYSGTENVVRILIEAREASLLEDLAPTLCEAVKSSIGAGS